MSFTHSINGKVALTVGSLFGATVLSIYWLSKLRRSRKISKLIDMVSETASVSHCLQKFCFVYCFPA